MYKLNALDLIALVLVIIGAVNWGLVGLFNFNLISVIFGDMSMVPQYIYTLVACSGLYLFIMLGKFSKK